MGCGFSKPFFCSFELILSTTTTPSEGEGGANKSAFQAKLGAREEMGSSSEATARCNEKSCPFAPSAGNELISGQNYVLTLRHWQEIKLFPICIAGQEVWCARGHGFARPRDWRLSESRHGSHVKPESKRAWGARARHHRNARLCSLNPSSSHKLRWPCGEKR